MAMNFKWMCRTCLREEHDLLPIMQITLQNYMMSDMIKDYLDLDVKSNTTLRGICKPCVNQLVRFHKFKTKCKSSDNILKIVLYSNNDEEVKAAKAILKDHALESGVTLVGLEKIINEVQGNIKKPEVPVVDLCNDDDEDALIREIKVENEDKECTHEGEAKEKASIEESEERISNEDVISDENDRNKKFDDELSLQKKDPVENFSLHEEVTIKEENIDFQEESTNDPIFIPTPPPEKQTIPEANTSQTLKRKHIEEHPTETAASSNSQKSGFLINIVTPETNKKNTLRVVKVFKKRQIVAKKTNEVKMIPKLVKITAEGTDVSKKCAPVINKLENSYFCDKCDRKYTLPGFLCWHLKEYLKHLSNHDKNIHTRRKLMKCKICNHKCHYPLDYDRHMDTEHPLVCKICGKDDLPNWHAYFEHRRSHKIKNKGHTCKQCGKAFRNASGLIYHTQVQSTSKGCKAFTCAHCGKNFSRKDSLNYHLTYKICLQQQIIENGIE